MIALAAAKKSRSKSQAKSEARAQGFFYLDQLEKDQPAMREPVTVVEYDMCSFLESCVERYVDLAGGNAKTIKKVPTPFHDDKIARPVENEQEIKGVLAPIATKVLMKILFAARMARFDLLRAVHHHRLNSCIGRPFPKTSYADKQPHRMAHSDNAESSAKFSGLIAVLSSLANHSSARIHYYELRPACDLTAVTVRSRPTTAVTVCSCDSPKP